MKQNSFRAVCLVFMALVLVASAFSDDSTIQLESKILDSFDQDEETPYQWNAMGSKFATKNDDDDKYPKLSYVATWPSAVFGSNREGKDLKSLGIWAKFDRRGYNWLDIYPTGGPDAQESGSAEEEGPVPSEIPIPGRAQILDVWVWGSNMNLNLEAYVRDYRGMVYRLPMGSLNYTGWRNLRAAIPGTISQSKRQLPRYAGLTFVKFRIWTSPIERVDNFYVYFDQLKILTDTFETHYDGEELQYPERIKELWSGEDSGSGTN
ncbi:MAG: flagellar filament outer layer protein FlaA [Treponema sp.]|jgi:hypothetical protein|nr:flagellar filament outer layer protein FlaA [Treponema sp.]